MSIFRGIEKCFALFFYTSFLFYSMSCNSIVANNILDMLLEINILVLTQVFFLYYN